MGTSIRRTLAVVAACAAMLGIGVLVATRGGRDPPARIWISDPPPPRTFGLAADLRESPGGPRVNDLRAFWSPTESGHFGLFCPRRRRPVDRVRDLFRSPQGHEFDLLPYTPTDVAESCDGTVWRAWDRAGDR